MPVALDWRHDDREAWTITVRTEAGTEIELSEGGSRLLIDGAPLEAKGAGEYPAIYQRFLDLIDARQSDIDVRPLRLVADAFLVGERTIVESFAD